MADSVNHFQGRDLAGALDNPNLLAVAARKFGTEVARHAAT
jgi:hypothetical protein